MTFSNTQLTKKYVTTFCIIYLYMTSFATISLDDYKKLVDNEKKYLI